MTEKDLIRELGELSRKYKLSDPSQENQEIGKRISEIRKQLGLEKQPRKDRRKSVVRWS